MKKLEQISGETFAKLAQMPVLQGKSPLFYAVAKDIVVYGKTQKQAAADNNATKVYANRVYKAVCAALERHRLPEGYKVLDNVLLPAREAARVLKLSNKTKAYLKVLAAVEKEIPA